MKITKEVKGQVAVISLSGELLGGPDAQRIQGLVKEYLQSGTKDVLMDLGGVPWINSGGLGILVACLTTVNREDGCLKLCQVSKRNHQIFMLAQLHKIFDTYEKCDEALAAFSE
jgi:anti-sigma B factor antagonist